MEIFRTKLKILSPQVYEERYSAPNTYGKAMIISKFLYKDNYISNKLMRVIKLSIADLW